ncbi:tyrosine tRNA ligase [Rickenella mellea]|uniref:Tyrosine--tRNA ligase n=1 Tax=Rickenella mellea TaxID=50990 RepID=A0A4Y7PZB2_9AGAM|nr:tyrosine tRNA ligase [Rickenella mellea]
MSATATPEERFEFITRRLGEVLGGDLIKNILSQGVTPKCYWGTAPTGRPHIGYFVPLTKIADFLHAGVEVKILLADVHAFLDNMKAPLQLVAHRTKYYEYLLRAVFDALGIPTSQLIFVEGSSYQLTREYSMDNYRLCATVTEHDAKKAGAEVVKQVESPLLSGLLYPGMQALDEQYLGVDFQFGGIDQRKIFTFAELYLPRLGYAKRAHLMNEMVPGLTGGKMSSSDAGSKIDILDPPEVVRKKINSAFCEEGNTSENGILSFVKAVLMPISQLRLEREAEIAKGGSATLGAVRSFVPPDAPPGTLFTISRDPKWGGPTHYNAFGDLERDFAEKSVHPKDLKGAAINAILALLEPIRAAYEASKEWQEVAALAYPDPNAKKHEKKKKEKKYHPPPPGKGKNATKTQDKPVQDAAKPDVPVTVEPPSGANVKVTASQQNGDR